MSILDIILLICFIPALVQGVRKGFIAQAISIASIIIGIWASSRFAEVVSEWLGKYITVSDQVMKVVAFALIFIAVFLVLAAVGKLLEGMFKMVTLGWLNRVAGLVFSLLKTSLILGILIMVFTSLNDTFDLVSEATLNESVLYPPFKEAAFKIFPYIKDMLTLN